jgi:hypothetical protein
LKPRRIRLAARVLEIIFMTQGFRRVPGAAKLQQLKLRESKAFTRCNLRRNAPFKRKKPGSAGLFDRFF